MAEGEKKGEAKTRSITHEGDHEAVHVESPWIGDV